MVFKMSFMMYLLISIQIISSLFVILFVLLQNGKGMDYNSSGSNSIFGSVGSGNFFSKMTKWSAIVFFSSTITLSYFIHKNNLNIKSTSIMNETSINGTLVPLSKK